MRPGVSEEMGWGHGGVGLGTDHVTPGQVVGSG